MGKPSLKIAVVGGGPAGLYFALLMKKAQPGHYIRVFEQNPAGATYGWGVVFSGRALGFLRDSDSPSYHEIESRMQLWEDLTIARDDQQIKIDGSRYSGIARLTLLNILQRHCLSSGVEISFEQRLPGTTDLAEYDLIVGSDGVNSVVRQQYAAEFETTSGYLSNKYVWYGTNQLFDTLSLIFRRHEGGSYVAHCYRYSENFSTFIVECDAATWRQAGFEGLNEEQNRQKCEQIFASDLGGHPLLLNKSAWLNFRVVTNRQWSHRNVVLLGDSLRTVHFSIGSGTRMALEDAIALFEAFQQTGQVAEALRLYEQNHRPSVEKLLGIARQSYLWYETFNEKLHLEAIPLAYDYLMRSGRIDSEALRQKAPRFAAAYQDWQGQTNRPGPGQED